MPRTQGALHSSATALDGERRLRLRSRDRLGCARGGSLCPCASRQPVENLPARADGREGHTIDIAAASASHTGAVLESRQRETGPALRRKQRVTVARDRERSVSLVRRSRAPNRPTWVSPAAEDRMPQRQELPVESDARPASTGRRDRAGSHRRQRCSTACAIARRCGSWRGRSRWSG